MSYPPVLAALLLAIAPSAAIATVAEDPAALPQSVRAMIEAAIGSGDQKSVATVIRLARETQPLAGAEIDEIADSWQARVVAAETEKKKEEQAALVRAGPFDHWKGQAELGASRSTGRTSYIGIFGSLELEREGVSWRHKLRARAEVQEGRNVTDVERTVAAWQPNYKFDDRLYGYGLAQVETDPVQGYDGRYTAGIGLGYALLTAANARLDVESGPAFRHVDNIEGAPYSSVAARASLNLRWEIAPTLELKQTGALYLEDGDGNANAITALDAQLIGPLKARLSYDVRYEDRLPGGGSTLDTLSRATLVYSF